MGFFTKKITVYKEKGCKAHWQTAKEALKNAGISFSSTSLPRDAPACGCGAKLYIGDFGPKGKIDRDMYYIDVEEKDVDRAREILASLDGATWA